MLFLVATLVSAGGGFPHPVNGVLTANGEPVKSATIIVENTITHNKVNAITSDRGFYQVDLGNFDPDYRSGDILKVSLAMCKDVPVCSKTVVISGGYNEVSFSVTEQQVIDGDDDDAVVHTYVCSDGSKVLNADNCPVIVPTVICEDGTEVESAEDCPAEDRVVEIALGILSALLGIAFVILGKYKWGKGFVGLANYYKKLGDEAKARKDYAEAEKCYTRAAKMVSTAVTKAKDGSYE